jgi:hypothetical protein
MLRDRLSEQLNLGLRGDAMGKKWAKGMLLFAVIGGMLLAMSVSLGLAQPETPADAIKSHPEGAALPASDGPIGAQAAPSASIVAPSQAIGDFGAKQGNVWDMNSMSDIVWTQSNRSGQTIQLSQPSPGIVRGKVPEGSDLAIAFYASSGTDLPSSQYHHLIYRLKIAAEGGCWTNGRVIYTTKWPDWLGSQASTYPFLPQIPPMSCPFGEFCVYYMDLSRNDNYPTWPTWQGASSPSSPSPWPTAGVKAFGMWPHEGWATCNGGPDYFDLDYVYLTGDIVAREENGYKYTARWQVSDPDGGAIISTIRYQAVAELRLPSDSPPCDGTSFNNGTWKDFSPVAQVTTNLSPPPSYPNKVYLPLIMGGSSGGTGVPNATYTLDFSDSSKFSNGTSYYLCIRVTDGSSPRYAVSSAPVIRVPRSPYFGPN